MCFTVVLRMTRCFHWSLGQMLKDEQTEVQCARFLNVGRPLLDIVMFFVILF